MLSEAIKAFIEEHKDDDVHQLLLSSQVLQGEDLRIAVQQIDGRQRIKQKLPSWYHNSSIYYPVHLSLEQCSSELTARYKEQLIKGDSLVDLTGGFGVDTTCLARNFKRVTYVEQNESLALIAQANFKAFGLDNISVKVGQAEQILAQLDEVDVVFIDPARRNRAGAKVISIADCTPNVLEIESELRKKAKKVLIKMSPMLDVTLACRELTNIGEIHIVAVQNECKELLLLMDNSKEVVKSPHLYCVNLKGKEDFELFSYSLDQELEASVAYSSEVQKYLYEPNVALLKAGAYKVMSEYYHLSKLHVNSHLYTSNELVEAFPGRQFLVESVYGFDKSSLKSLKKNVKAANLTIRNFPSTVAQLRKKLKIVEGGNKYLFATTLHSGDKVIIVCSKI